MSNIILEKFSHISYGKMHEISVIKKILKGETYFPNNFDFKIKEDYIHKSEIIRLFAGDKCIAKEDRWYSGDGTFVRTINDVISDWNGHIFYDEENNKWYYKPWLEICFLNGDKRKVWFNNDEELTDELERITKNTKNYIILGCED
jgi:hypothetical protein